MLINYVNKLSWNFPTPKKKLEKFAIFFYLIKLEKSDPTPPLRDLRDQFLRFETETETEQVQSQQARPRLKRYSLNKRDRVRDSYLQIFETETETRKMCIFET